jgi:uncharacterized membrane protein YcaP (DUF421 family)
MKNSQLQCFKHTIVFVLGIIIGGVLINPLSGIGQLLIILTTGLAFFITQKVSFPSFSKKETLNKVV